MAAWGKLCIAGTLALSVHCHAQTTPEAAPATDGQIERVLITAERRSTTLDTTPAAITTLSGPRLAEQGATSLADVLNLAPNTSFSSQSSTQIFIRGIGDVFLLAGGDPGVALYACPTRPAPMWRCSIPSASKSCAVRKARCTAATPPAARST